MIYLDNASTSYPKPEACKHRLATFYDDLVGSYGRSGDAHTLSLSTEIEMLRDLLAERLGAKGHGERLVFTQHATQAINMVLSGMPLRREEVLLSPMQHNAVTRPLHKLSGTNFSVLPALSDGVVDLVATEQGLKRGKWRDAKLLVINAMSNVNGAIQVLDSLIELLRRYLPKIKVLIDAAQALPYVEIDVETCRIDFVAITGHKGLLGPTGTGALYIREGEIISPIMRGGNGTQSAEQDDTKMMPDRFEVGTMNMISLLAWKDALINMPQPLITALAYRSFLERLSRIDGISLYTAMDPALQGPVFSLRSQEYLPHRLADILREDYEIISRSGLHCAPMAHQTLKTFDLGGTTRFSLSPYTRLAELDRLSEALIELHG